MTHPSGARGFIPMSNLLCTTYYLRNRIMHKGLLGPVFRVASISNDWFCSSSRRIFRCRDSPLSTLDKYSEALPSGPGPLDLLGPRDVLDLLIQLIHQYLHFIGRGAPLSPLALLQQVQLHRESLVQKLPELVELQVQ